MRQLSATLFRPLLRLLRSANDTSGNIAIAVAGVFFVLAAVFSLSLDIGLLYSSKRTLQAAVDMSVLKAVTNPNMASALVSDVLEANGVLTGLSEAPDLRWGSFPPSGYTMDNVGDLPIEDRFQAGGANANALQVTIRDVPRLYLVNLFFDSSVQVSARAIAANFPLAQIAIGSDVLGFDSDKATAFNGLLSSLLGTSVNMTAGGYNGLADANIQMIGFLDALATEAGITAGDYDAVLAEEFTMPQIAAAVLTAIGEDDDFDGDVAAVTAGLGQLAGDLTAMPAVPLGDVLAVDAENPDKAAGARINLLDLLVGTGEAASAEHGLSAEVSVPIAGGVARLTVAAIEPRQFSAIGGVGTTVETSQVRIFLVIEPTQTLALAGVNFDVRLPVLIESTKGVATITDLSCPTALPANASVGVTATPSVLQTGVVDIDPAALGEATTPAGQPGEIVNGLGLLRVTATGQVNYSGTPGDLDFVAAFDVDNVQTVSTNDPVVNAGTTLFESLTYDVDILGLPLITEDMVTDALEPVVAAAAPAADALLAEVLEALGIRAGNTDVSVPYVKCSNPALIL